MHLKFKVNYFIFPAFILKKLNKKENADQIKLKKIEKLS